MALISFYFFSDYGILLNCLVLCWPHSLTYNKYLNFTIGYLQIILKILENEFSKKGGISVLLRGTYSLNALEGFFTWILNFLRTFCEKT